jgi:hypothetical protein
MRRVLAAVVVVLLLAPGARAQIAAGPAVRTVPIPAEVAAQATFDTSYLLAGYMAQLAAAGTPPTQADIDEATQQYFTNGAALATVPSSGPGSDYFRNGAAVTGVPTSGPGAAYFRNGAEMTAYSGGRSAPIPEATGAQSASTVETESYNAAPPEDAGAPAPGAAPGGVESSASRPPTVAEAAGATSQVQTASSTPSGLTCTPLEIEAAMAIARQFASVASPAASCPPAVPSRPVASLVETAPTRVVVGPAVGCAPEPSILSRVVPALGGLLFGGLAVAVWSRPRLLRAEQRR